MPHSRLWVSCEGGLAGAGDPALNQALRRRRSPAAVGIAA
jgi:hypothetical protein